MCDTSDPKLDQPVVEDFEEEGSDDEGVDSSFCTEMQLKALMENSIMTVLDFLGMNSEDCAPDTMRFMKSSLIGRSYPIV